MNDALAIVSRALDDEASRAATAFVEETRSQSAQRVETATREVQALLDAARLDGEAEARRAGASLTADARREARQLELGGQRDLYDRVRTLALDRLRATATTPQWAAVRARLEQIARDRLGGDVVVTTAPDGVGVVASTKGRVLDLSLSALVDDQLRQWSARLMELVG